MKKVLIIFLIAIAFIVGGLYLAYLLACEDDWCYHYEWQKERKSEEINSESDSSSVIDGANDLPEDVEESFDKIIIGKS